MVIAPLTVAAPIGSVCVGVVGAVVSRTICFVTLYELSDQLLKRAVMFFVPSPAVRLIACNVYGNGMSNGTPDMFVPISPFTDTFDVILAKRAACTCVVFV